MELIVELENEDDVTYNNETVYINTKKLDKINELLSIKKYIKNQINFEERQIDEDDLFDIKKLIESLYKYLDNPLTLDDFKEITIKTNNIDDLFKNKSFLKNYENDIFINLNTNNFTYDKIKELSNMKFKGNVYVRHEYNNNNYYELKEFLDTLTYVEETKQLTEKFNLSELEKLMFIYDIIKDRVYNKKGDYNESRDLDKVIKGDAIVCSGFANIFSSVANLLGIKTEKRFYFNEDENVGHVTNICYINDTSYNYKGILEFDTTWDSKSNKRKANEDSYNFFGLSLEKAKKIKEEGYNQIEDEEFYLNSVSRVKKQYKSYQLFNLSFITKSLLEQIKQVFINLKDEKKVKEIDDLINNIEDSISIKEQDIEDLMKKIKDFESKNLSSNIFLKVFIKTRRIEHYLNPKKYNYDKDTIFKVFSSRYSESETTRLFRLIFGNDGYNDMILKNALTDSYFEKMSDLKPSAKIALDKERIELLNVITKIDRKGR